MPYPLNTLFDNSVAKYASKYALEEVSGAKLTYHELGIKVKKLSELLVLNNIDTGSRVGILASKNTDVVISIFSILKSKAAYVPLDVSAPVERARSIINDGDFKALFIETAYLEKYAEIYQAWSYRVEQVSKELSLLIFNKETCVSKEPLAYILYTSGSTGLPKGVMHTHQSAFAFVNWSMKKFKPQPEDKFISHAPFHFDLSVFDLYVAIGVGATLLLMDEKDGANPLELAKRLDLHKISYFYATPSTLIYLSNYGKIHKYAFSALKCILFAGEVFPIEQLRKIKSQLQQVAFFNLYGPTETNVCTYFKVPSRIPKKQTQPYPIGKTCSYAKAYIANGGELYISGKSLMLGYWNDKPKTGKSFFIDEHNIKWYKTGDLISVSTNGNLVYTGRKDRMVKRHSYRIELAEIEYVLSKNANILQVAVTASSLNGQTDNTITGHISLTESRSITELEVFKYCEQTLPKYMIPDKFVFYDKLPVTSTNKIDYKKLTS